MAQVGRISGPLLFANLERNGIDLSFRNTVSQEPLIFLDVNNNTVGINRDTASHEVDITGVSRTDNLISGSLAIPNFSIDNSTISATVGNIVLDSNTAVRFSAFATDSLELDENSISNTVSNESIEISPNGTGEVNVNSNLNVFGNIFTPGNVTLEGNITFGNELTEDTVDFSSELNSNIIPKQSNEHSLGRSDKTWKDVYTRFVNGEAVVTDNIISGEIDFALRQGRIIYVDTNGDDTNTGTHKQDPVRTIKQALSQATESEIEPLVIFVNSGEYLEELPLEVPNRVSVIGENIRNTIVKPAAGFENSNVFLLDGDTTVQDITVKDFFNGYAFSYRPNAQVIGRSPYIQNISVITKGSATTLDDPRGYQAGDAGKGALVDGSVVNNSVVNPSMLFSQCTFITPGVTALEAKNGVRIEWLFCFTYFASTGILAETDVELRAMSCANVYGERGVVANGADCVLYLISHNFAYIGAEFSTDNDRTQTITENEITELNGARVFHNSIDETGTYKIGSDFFVDFETGQTTLDVDDVNVDSFTQLNFTSGNSETFVDANVVETGLLRFSQNNLTSVSGDINLNTQGILAVNPSVSISKTLDAVNAEFNSNLVLGSSSNDEAVFNSDIASSIIPTMANIYDLGSVAQEWNSLFTNRVYTQDILIQNNFIETRTTNTDLELQASGLGKVTTDRFVLFGQNASVQGTISFTGTNVNVIETNVQADIDVAGNFSISQNLAISNSLDTTSSVQFEDILFNNNFVTTTRSNSDLELRANQTGKVLIPTNSVAIENNISVNNIQSNNNIGIDFSVTSPNFVVADIQFLNNTVSTENIDLQLTAKGTGEVNLENVSINSNTVRTDNDIVLKPNTVLKINSSASLQLPTGDSSFLGSQGNLRFETDDNLFEAYNTGRITFGGVFSDDRNTSVTATNATETVEFKTNNVLVGTVTATTLNISKIEVDDVVFDNNVIETKNNKDLILDRNGTGKLVIGNLSISSNIFENTAADLYNLSGSDLGYAKFNATTGLVLPQGTTAEQDSSPPTGDTRFNTETNIMEVFNGVNYISAAGVTATVSEEEYNELVEIFTLVFG